MIRVSIADKMRKIRGGALIGQGTYGCVMSPPPKSSMCEFDNNKKHMPKMSSMVAKIFTDDKNADEEWEMAKQLQEIDARQDYFLYALNRCYTRMSDFALDPDVEQCEIVGDMAKQSRQKQRLLPTLYMPKGGRSIADVLRMGGVGPRDFIRAMMPIFEGVDHLVRHKLIHHDLKYDNILYVPERRSCRAIDFGISTTFSKAFSPADNAYLSVRYWLHPPEYTAWVFLYKEFPDGDWPNPIPDPMIRDIFQAIMHILQIQLHRQKTLGNMILELYSYCDYEREFIEFMRDVTKRPGISHARRMFEACANKIDIYSLGITNMYLLSYIDSTEHPHLYKELQSLTKEMVRIDPRKRIVPAKAVKIASKIAKQ